MCTLCREPDFLMTFYLTHARSLMENALQIWNGGYSGELELLERVQNKWTRVVRDLENVSDEQRLRQLELFSFQGRLLQADLVYVWLRFNQQCGIISNGIFQFPHASTSRRHTYKLYVHMVSLDIRTRFFTRIVIRHWNAFSANTVLSKYLGAFKSLLRRGFTEALYEFQGSS